jgi:hypothetical protein
MLLGIYLLNDNCLSLNVMSEELVLYVGLLVALFVLAFLAAAAFSPIDRKVQIRSGTIQQNDESTFALGDDLNLTNFTLDPTAAIFLNERTTGCGSLRRGRKVVVYYKKQKGKLFATLVQIVPTPSDCPSRAMETARASLAAA